MIRVHMQPDLVRGYFGGIFAEQVKALKRCGLLSTTLAEVCGQTVRDIPRSEGNAAAVSETGGQRWPGALRVRWFWDEGRGFFFPPRLSEPSGLQEGVGHHRYQGMAVKPGPESSFEVIEAKFFLELLMRLFADPARLDRTSGAVIGVSRGRLER